VRSLLTGGLANQTRGKFALAFKLNVYQICPANSTEFSDPILPADGPDQGQQFT